MRTEDYIRKYDEAQARAEEALSAINLGHTHRRPDFYAAKGDALMMALMALVTAEDFDHETTDTRVVQGGTR